MCTGAIVSLQGSIPPSRCASALLKSIAILLSPLLCCLAVVVVVGCGMVWSTGLRGPLAAILASNLPKCGSSIWSRRPGTVLGRVFPWIRLRADQRAHLLPVAKIDELKRHDLVDDAGAIPCRFSTRQSIVPMRVTLNSSRRFSRMPTKNTFLPRACCKNASARRSSRGPSGRKCRAGVSCRGR